MLEAYAALMDRADVAVNDKRELVERIAKLYESWNVSQPGQGYVEKAADWREKLDSVRPQNSLR
jgi:histidinol-phosphate/aromatic aminotransferase/cobyric acid decarboxylase-like protein